MTEKVLDLKTLSSATFLIAEERGIPKERVYEAMEKALAAAYKKEYGDKKKRYKAKIDRKAGTVSFFETKIVVDKETLEKEEKKYNPFHHVLLEEAKRIKEDAKVGDEIEIPLESVEKFGRIAAQTAKQVLLQKLKEIERETIYNEFKKREEEIISGTIQKKEKDRVVVDLGKTSAILPKEEEIKGEFYKIGQRMRFYILKVSQTPKGPEIILSRKYPKFVSKLFELEVPEIASGVVKVRAIARIPGVRTKIAVSSEDERVDPVGSLIGQRGIRINAVMQELGREKIDVILWSEKPEEFIKNALSPAKVLKVELQDSKAIVEVSKDQYFLVIGKDGENVKLASDLTGWRIEVKKVKVLHEKEKETRT